MPKTLVPNVLLDLDGTLTDPAPGFVGSVRYALITLGVVPPPDSEITPHIGPPLEEALGTLLGYGRDAAVPEAVRLYRERYSSTGLFENSVYEGIREALESIAGSGGRIFLATSKPAVFASKILEHFGLVGFFAGIYGSQLDGTHADKRELLAHLLESESIDPEDAIMVGDRSYDIRAARTNGLRSLGVLWGYGSEAELRDAGADGIVAAPRELPEAIRI